MKGISKIILITIFLMLIVFVGAVSAFYVYDNYVLGKYVEPYGELVNFKSLDELVVWLADDRTDEHLQDIWCPESAEMLIRAAEESGYRLHMEYLWGEEYEDYFHKEIEYDGHAMVSAVIGDKAYLINQYTDKIWVYGTLKR